MTSANATEPVPSDGCRCGSPTCSECATMAALADVLRDDFNRTSQLARVPTPEIVWWRAQMRAREEANRAALRPILLTQAVSMAALIGVLVAAAGRISLPLLAWLPLVPETLPLLPIAIVLACWIVVAPLVLYFAD